MTNEEMVKTVDEIGKRLYALNIDLNEMEKNLDVCCEMIAEVYANIGGSRWTGTDVEYAKIMKEVHPDAYRVERSRDGENIMIFDNDEALVAAQYFGPICLAKLKPGESVELDEIIGGAE